MPPDDGNDAMGDLAAALDALGSSVAALRASRPPRPVDAPALVREWRRDLRLPPVVAGGGDADDELVLDPPPLMSPEDVEAEWLSGGPRWLSGASRRELTSVVAAALHPTMGPNLMSLAGFVPALFSRLRPRQLYRLLNTAYFTASGLEWVPRLMNESARSAPEDVPRWWVSPGTERAALAAAVAPGAATSPYAQVLEAFDLPDAVSEAFLASVAQAAQLTTSAGVATLVEFVDRGQALRKPALMQDSTREWARAAARVGRQYPRERIGLAELLRGRVGEIVGRRDDDRWSGLTAERAEARNWLVGAIFRLLFEFLVPDGAARHQTEPRRRFWAEYDQSVERVFLLVCDDHRGRLDRNDAVSKLVDHGLLELRRFEGQSQQDAVWMHLRTVRGDIVTVLEGNANMPIRIRREAVGPPGGTVHYSQARWSLGAEAELRHLGDWQSRASTVLADCGVYRRGAQ